jgi:hypothetical protein
MTDQLLDLIREAATSSVRSDAELGAALRKQLRTEMLDGLRAAEQDGFRPAPQANMTIVMSGDTYSADAVRQLVTQIAANRPINFS